MAEAVDDPAADNKDRCASARPAQREDLAVTRSPPDRPWTDAQAPGDLGTADTLGPHDTPVDSLSETLAHPASTAPLTFSSLDSEHEPPRGDVLVAGLLPQTAPARIGRYTLLDCLGRGGMGIVYAAYDPELDRRVAIKLLTAPLGQAEARLRLEAQAMARVVHANVVSVIEVGVHHGQTYVVMEYLRGISLERWPERRPDWRATLRVYIQAGRGLAAAHRAGVIHRDFKPHNVMLVEGGSDDGRVKVLDFGLARAALQDPQGPTPGRSTDARPPSLTQSGAVMGTPAYMAPEQFTGAPVDERSDQFSFCVALWEALYGQRPFAGATFAELAINVTGARRLPPPTGSSVPAWLRRVLERGLSSRPDERHPTTDALLAALKADPTRWQRALAGSAVVALAVGGGLAVQGYREARQVAACVADGASITTVWNEDVQRRLHDGLLATGVTYAQTTSERVMPYFAAQAAAWQHARTEACLDTRVRGIWNEATLDRSTWCLDERRIELATLIDELSRASATSAQNAVVAAAQLSQLGPCRDTHHLDRLGPLPPDQERVTALLTTLSRAAALQFAGEYQSGLDQADDGLAAAEAIGWPSLVAASHFRRGDLLEEAGKYPEAEAALESAYFQAATVGALEVAAEAAVKLTYTVGYQQARHDEGRRWSRHADVALSLLGPGEDSLLHAEALGALASVRGVAAAYDEEKALHQRALAIREKVLGPEHPIVARSLHNLASVHESRGEYDQAKALQQRVLAIRETTLGPEHPDVANALNNLATTYEITGAFAEARQLHERALAIREKTLGPEHPDVATSLNNLGVVHYFAGDHELAQPAFERALAIREKALAGDHPDIATSLNNLAGVALARGSLEDAKALFKRVLALREKALGPDHPDVATALDNLGSVLRTAGEYPEARALHERALAILEHALGPEHPSLGITLANLARVHHLSGAHDEARALYTRALALSERALGPDHPQVTRTRANLAELEAVIARH